MHSNATGNENESASRTPVGLVRDARPHVSHAHTLTIHRTHTFPSLHFSSYHSIDLIRFGSVSVPQSKAARTGAPKADHEFSYYLAASAHLPSAPSPLLPPPLPLLPASSLPSPLISRRAFLYPPLDESDPLLSLEQLRFKHFLAQKAGAFLLADSCEPERFLIFVTLFLCFMLFSLTVLVE